MGKKDHRDDTIVIKAKSGTLEYKYDSDDSGAERHRTDRDHYVKWFSNAGNYSIVFGQHSPFAHPCYSKKKGEVLSIPVRPDAKRYESYKYTVVVEIRDNNHIIDDPQIVID